MFLTKITYSPGIDGQILSQLFLVGGNHEIWHKDAFKGREFKLIRSYEFEIQNIDIDIFFMTVTGDEMKRSP